MRDHPLDGHDREAGVRLVRDLSRQAAKETKFPIALSPAPYPTLWTTQTCGRTWASAEDRLPALSSSTNITYLLNNCFEDLCE